MTTWHIPDALRPAFEKLAEPVPQRDKLDWARAIVAKHERGEHVANGTLDIARQALKNARSA
jgi:hypothetical protein